MFIVSLKWTFRRTAGCLFVYTFALVSFFSRLIGNQGDYVQKHSCVFLEVAANRPTLFFNQNKVLNVFSNLTFYRLESGNGQSLYLSAWLCSTQTQNREGIIGGRVLHRLSQKEKNKWEEVGCKAAYSSISGMGRLKQPEQPALSVIC